MAYEGSIIPIPIGQFGLDGRDNENEIPPGSLVEAEGIDYEGRVLRKEGGAEKLDSTAVTDAPVCRGLFDWHPVDGTQRLISAWNDGKIYKEVDGDVDSVTLKSGLSPDKSVQFIEGGEEVLGNDRKLFACNGTDPVQVLTADGTTTSDLSTPPADWSGSNQPINMAKHSGPAGTPGGGFMWGFLGHRAYRSKLDDHEDYTTTAYQIAVGPSVGTKIMAGLTFDGIFYFLKDEGLFWLDDSDAAEGNWYPRLLSSVMGVASPSAWAFTGNDVLILSKYGRFFLLTAVREKDKATGNVRAADLGNAMFLDPWLRENVNFNRLDLATATPYPHKNTVEFSVPRKGFQVPNIRLRFNFEETDVVKFSHSKRDEAYVLALRKHPTEGIQKPIHGDGAGFVWSMDTKARNKDSAGYDGIAKTHSTDSGVPNNQKGYDGLEVEFKSVDGHDLTVAPFVDGKERTARTLEMQGPGDPIDGTSSGFTLGTSSLGAEGTFTRRARVTGSGRRFSVEVKTTGADEDFRITALRPMFKPLNSFASARD
tara:strand:- start:4640 stop:6250 length:1611 start_codon:yes stop_codon:yes gene_type:complete